MTSARLAPQRRTTTPRPGPGNNVLLYAMLGSSRARKHLVYWYWLRRFAQACWDHPLRTLLVVSLGLLTGWLGSMTYALDVVGVLGWLLLAHERRGGQPWRPAKGSRPWRRPFSRFWKGYLDTRRCYCAALGSGVTLTVLPYGAAPALTSLLGLANLWLIAKLRVPPDKTPRWWEEKQLLALWVDAGVLTPRAGQALMLSRCGKAVHDDKGTHVTFELPGSTVWTEARAKTAQAAAFLGLPREQVKITHRERTATGEPTSESEVTLSVLKPRESTSGGLSWICSAERTDATQPYRVGDEEETGEPLYMENEEVNDLTAGIPGAGKTEWSRIMIGTYLLDPRATIYALDGKGSRKDYGPMTGLCEVFVWGTSEDAPEQLLSMLERVLGIVRQRNTLDDGTMDWPPILVLAEELQDVLAGAEPDVAAAIVDTLGRIVRMGRAVRVKVSIITQRTSVDDLPSKVRNLLAQRTAFRTLQPRDFGLVLGVDGGKIDVRLPTRKVGQAVLRLPSGLHALAPDRVPLAEWQALCARAGELRSGRAAETVEPVSLVKAETEPPAEVDPLLAEVLRHLAREPMQALALWKVLDHSLRPKDAVALGKWLALHPEAVRRERHGKSFAWHSRTTLASTAAAPSPEGQNGQIRAQTHASEGLTYAARSLP